MKISLSGQRYCKKNQIKIKYIPDIGFLIDSVKIEWKETRISVRKKLLNQHIDDNRIIKMSELFGGDKSHDIIQRRDIYENINGIKNSFFLRYNQENKLREIEIHGGAEIFVKGVRLKFDTDIDAFLQEFEKIGESYTETEEGNYLFENLKMTMATSEAAGGDGNVLSYFYAGHSIGHLLKENK